MNKKVVIGAIIILILIIYVGTDFIISKSSSTKVLPTPTPVDEQIFTLKPSDIGLKLTQISTGKFADHGVEMQIAKLADIISIDYELDYTAAGNIPRGAIGHVDIKPGDTSISQQLPFGTCSDVCHFDTEIMGVNLTLKVAKKDGKTYSVVQPFSF